SRWRLRISKEALDHVVAHARATVPAECCGLLVGRGDRIAEAIAAPNLSDDPNRFILDPQAHIETRRDARRRGLDVLGFYHSHPHSPAEPSATDLAEASYHNEVYLIVSVQAEPADARLF